MLSYLEHWLKEPEGERLEFKEARNSFEVDKLTKYCCALANEGGGRIILGVTNKRPRTVTGTLAFNEIERTRTALIQRLHLKIEAFEISHPNGRVLVFEIPSRPVGMGVQYLGAYWQRNGEALAPMSPDVLKRIFAEGQPDFSAETCSAAGIDDLDYTAIEIFRERWSQKSKRDELKVMPVEQLLEDAELLLDGNVTFAALLLLGSQKALTRLLGQAEIIFEYRSDEASVSYQDRREFRAGFLTIKDSIWEVFNLRNQILSFRDGLFRREIRAFNEDAVREGILNAFCHRDYRLEGSIFIRQFPTQTEITSPGGFPPEITPENILFRQSPRNRRLAEACSKCGLVERSGQGVDRMVAVSVQEGKLPPDYCRSDAFHVALTLHGQVHDSAFLQFLEKVLTETQKPFRTDDLVVIDAIHRGIPIPQTVTGRIASLIDVGVIERVSRKKLVLSRKFYSFVGRRGEYTRKKGLERPAKRALLQQHLENNAGSEGCPLKELMEVLPELSRSQVQVMLREMKEKQIVHAQGIKRAARWFPGPRSPRIVKK
ncbi:MAG: putative DNA binding domain-containing protein [Deltaproteobacteria bacterium]|nr:putative DNA binding domain-containing protein [Deltaproteobacteria bacterium]